MKSSILILFLSCCFPSTLCFSSRIPSFYVNKNLDLSSRSCSSQTWTCYNPECVMARTNFTIPTEMTVCFRYKLSSYLGQGTPILSFGSMKEDWRDLDHGMMYGVWNGGHWIGIKRFGIAGYGWIGGPVVKGEFDLQVWRHTCFTINTKNGMYKVFEDGKKYMNKTFDGIVNYAKNDKMHDKPADIVTLGCAFYSTGSKTQSNHVRITDLQIVNKELSDENLEAVTGCRQFLQGNVVNWQKDEFYLNTTIIDNKNISEVEMVDLDNEVCKMSNESFVLLPHKMNFINDGLDMCDKFSGKIASHITTDDYEELTGFLSKIEHREASECVSSVKDSETDYVIKTWIGAHDSKEEGVFVDWYTGKKIEHLPWDDGRPYTGGDKYNCIQTSLTLRDTGEWKAADLGSILGDEICEGLMSCNTCAIPHPVRKIFVRGLCKESSLDRTYLYTIHPDGSLVYLGYKASSIRYNTDAHLWHWIDRNDNNTLVTSDAAVGSFLLGVHTFDFSQVKDKCTEGKGSKIIDIKLTTCQEGQFTCQDGQCVSIDVRCDQKPDCRDGSDEIDCIMLVIQGNYNKKIAPFKFDPVANIPIPANVNVSVYIKAIISLKEVSLEYVLKYSFKMEWYDYRLTYYNLKKSRSGNALPLEDINRLWVPLIVFKNTEQNEATRGDPDSEITITREGDFTSSGDDRVEEINIFTGKENRITFERVYTKTFRCEYALQLYPFDTQTCTVEMIIKKLERSVVKLTPHVIAMEGQTILTQYIVQSWTLDYINPDDHSKGINLVIKLKRRIMNEVLTTYLPSFLLLIIVHITNYFKPFFFEAVVSVNLTSLLVLTTLFISVSTALPKTAYVKMIDIWLIFAQLVPFFEVLLHTAMDSLRGEEGEEREINHHGKAIKVGGDGQEISDSESTQSTVMSRVGSALNSRASKIGVGDTAVPVDVERKSQGSGSTYSPQGSVYKATAPTLGDMVQLDEKKLVKARADFYKNAEISHKTMLAAMEFTGKTGIPVFILIFSIIYWAYGLSHYL